MYQEHEEQHDYPPILWKKKGRRRGRSYRRKLRGRNRHHMVPKDRGGVGHMRNLLLMKLERHKAWHRIFKLMTAQEALGFVRRARWLNRHKEWRRVFGEMTTNEAAELLARVIRAKQHQMLAQAA